jgi:hypothetical protein
LSARQVSAWGHPGQRAGEPAGLFEPQRRGDNLRGQLPGSGQVAREPAADHGRRASQDAEQSGLDVRVPFLKHDELAALCGETVDERDRQRVLAYLEDGKARPALGDLKQVVVGDSARDHSERPILSVRVAVERALLAFALEILLLLEQPRVTAARVRREQDEALAFDRRAQPIPRSLVAQSDGRSGVRQPRHETNEHGNAQPLR